MTHTAFSHNTALTQFCPTFSNQRLLYNIGVKYICIFSGRIMAANMGSMRILIKGGKVVNDDFTQEADVYIENGIIQQVTHVNTQYAFIIYYVTIKYT